MQLRNVLSYYFKNILYMLLFAIIPAVFIGVVIHPFSLIEMLYNYPSMASYTFGSFFANVYMGGWWLILWFILGFLILVVAISFLVGKIEFHFRTGRFDISSHSARGLNNNFGDLAIMALLMMLVDFILNLLAILLMFLTHFIICADGGAVLASTIINWVIGILFTAFEGVCTCVFMFAAIDMIIMGSPLTVAISNVFNSYSQKIWSNILVGAFPFLVGIALTVIGSLIGVVWLTNIISMLFIIPYVCILGMVQFFKYYDIPRYDNRKYYNLK